MSRTRLSMVCVVILALLAANPSVGRAQFRRVVVRPPVVRPVFGPRFFPVPVYHFNAGSYLQGAAAVIDAQGRYLKNLQQAYLLREQVRAAQLDNRRRVFEQWQYERANTPTLEEQREFRRQQEFWRSWNNPPLTEIWSGRALNNLLGGVQRGRSEGYLGATVPLDPELVQRINVTSDTLPSSLGALQHPDDLRWPPPLRREAFDKERNEIDKLAPQAVKQVAAGNADVKAVDSLSQAILRLRSVLRDNVREMSSTDYMQALRHVNHLIDSVRTLQSPGAVNFFSKWTITARSVGELVDQMTEKGLRFAAATPGDEMPYTSLHQALVTYASGLPLESLRDLRAQFYSTNSPKAEK